jgi:D-amino-acid dehydrogenase
LGSAEGRRVQSVDCATSSAHGDSMQTFEADQFVIAAGNQSYTVCSDLNIPCPIFPCKGYIIVFRSDAKVPTNIELRNKAFVAPFGDGKYHLSGFAEFTSEYHTNRAMHIDQDRADALIKAAGEIFPDMEVESTHVGYRPLSPDDTPLIGRTKYANLLLCTGGGSKGWSQGPGSGQLLADIVLGNDTRIDADPYNPRRFEFL